jgi:hypothetical protein
MSHILAILTAGRKEYLDITIGSLEKHLKGSISEKIIFDNSDGPEITYDGYRTIKIPGFGLPYGNDRHAKAIQFIFDYLIGFSEEHIVFFEEDWALLEEVVVDELSIYLDDRASQLRLYSRGEYGISWYQTEDIIATSSDFSFSWNPCIFNKKILYFEYPQGHDDHEYHFGKKVGENFFLYKYGTPVVKHVGEYSIEKPVRWSDKYEKELL